MIFSFLLFLFTLFRFRSTKNHSYHFINLGLWPNVHLCVRDYDGLFNDYDFKYVNDFYHHEYVSHDHENAHA